MIPPKIYHRRRLTTHGLVYRAWFIVNRRGGAERRVKFSTEHKYLTDAVNQLERVRELITAVGYR